MSTHYSDDFTVKDFEAGDCVELHPATDAWMQGDRFGLVCKVGRKYIHVSMDRSSRILQFLPKYVGQILRDPEPQSPPVCDNRIEEVLNNPVIGGNTYFPAPAQVFTVQGARVSTRSSKPWKRSLAKKILRETSK